MTRQTIPAELDPNADQLPLAEWTGPRGPRWRVLLAPDPSIPGRLNFLIQDAPAGLMFGDPPAGWRSYNARAIAVPELLEFLARLGHVYQPHPDRPEDI